MLDSLPAGAIQVGPVGGTRSGLLWLLILAITAGCTTIPIVGPAVLLARADRQAREGAWDDAVRSYDEYLGRFPDDEDAPRILESRDTLAAMLTARAEVARRREEVTRLQDELTKLEDEGTRLREDGTRQRAEVTTLRDEVIKLRDERVQLRNESGALREELTRREGDLARTRQELAARQAEAEKLRTYIERLKEIDLKLERKPLTPPPAR
jgi:chromosome segregation ATPase